MDKHKTMLEEEPKKIGFRLSSKRLRETVARQIFTTKHVEHIPSTIFANETYKAPHTILPTIKEKDHTKMTGGYTNFDTNIKNNVLSKSPTSKKVFIQPISTNEMNGPKWYPSSVASGVP